MGKLRLHCLYPFHRESLAWSN